MLVVEERSGKVLWLRLNRPDKLNAMNDDMLHQLLNSVARAEQDDSVGAVVLTGNGRAFSAGGDIQAMEGTNESGFRESVHLYMRLAGMLQAMDKITVAAVNGYALAGGLELALMCDVRVAGHSAVFGLPDAEIGLSPTSGMTWLLPRVVGLGRAMHITLTGQRFSGSEAERIGLVTAVTEDDALESEAGALASRIAEYPREAVTGTKRGFYQAADRDFATAMAGEEQSEILCFRSGETQKKFADFLARDRHKNSST